MNESTMWKYLDKTREFLREVEEEIKKTEQEVTDGGLIISPALEREYCRAVGYLEGLKYLVNKLKVEEQEDETT